MSDLDRARLEMRMILSHALAGWEIGADDFTLAVNEAAAFAARVAREERERCAARCYLIAGVHSNPGVALGAKQCAEAIMRMGDE